MEKNPHNVFVNVHLARLLLNQDDKEAKVLVDQFKELRTKMLKVSDRLKVDFENQVAGSCCCCCCCGPHV